MGLYVWYLRQNDALLNGSLSPERAEKWRPMFGVFGIGSNDKRLNFANFRDVVDRAVLLAESKHTVLPPNHEVIVFMRQLQQSLSRIVVRYIEELIDSKPRLFYHLLPKWRRCFLKFTQPLRTCDWVVQQHALFLDGALPEQCVAKWAALYYERERELDAIFNTALGHWKDTMRKLRSLSAANVTALLKRRPALPPAWAAQLTAAVRELHPALRSPSQSQPSPSPSR